MTAEQQQELAALAALGALDGPDVQAWQALSTASPKARREADRFAEVASLLALGVKPQPPARDLKARVMAQIGQSAPKFSFTLDSDDSRWKHLPVPGVRLKELCVNPAQGYAMVLLDLAPGAKYPGHFHTQAEECYVLKGDCYLEGRQLGPGDFHHAAAGTQHQPAHTVNGCTLLIVAGTKDYLEH